MPRGFGVPTWIGHLGHSSRFAQHSSIQQLVRVGNLSAMTSLYLAVHNVDRKTMFLSITDVRPLDQSGIHWFFHPVYSQHMLAR